MTSTAASVAPSTVLRCIESVRRQSFTNVRHVYFLASATDDDLARIELPRDDRIELRGGVYPMAPVLANLWPLWRALPDDEVIAWVDGDDYLATPYALEIVARAHAAGALATYGQFMWADGSIGFAAPTGPAPRSEPWRATHLKTFRAGLVKRIREADLKMPDGQWSFLNDQPVMLPVLEMAGAHATFIPKILYVYDVLNMQAELTRHSSASVDREHAEVARVRSLPAYGRLPVEEYARIVAGSARTA